jgi:hypothetical protein
MITVDIKSDIDTAIGEVADFFRRQMPFVMDNAINATAKDVQTQLATKTIPSGWTVRNRALANAMTRFIPDQVSGQGGLLNSRSKPNKKTIVIGPAAGKGGWLAGEGFAERQVTGATKKPRGTAIAVPNIGPGLKRLAGGSIPAAKKPKNLRGNDKFFVKGNAIFERMGANGDRLRLRYALVNQAKGTTALAGFFPDAFATVDKVFPGYFDTFMTKAIATSRFNP